MPERSHRPPRPSPPARGITASAFTTLSPLVQTSKGVFGPPLFLWWLSRRHISVLSPSLISSSAQSHGHSLRHPHRRRRAGGSFGGDSSGLASAQGAGDRP